MHAHARSTDPVTSGLAAATVSDLSDTQARVLSLFGEPADRIEHTRDSLIAAWRARWPERPATDQSIRSRLAELMDAGRIVAVAHTANARGRQVQVLALAGTDPALF